jgi:hypothetical protein
MSGVLDVCRRGVRVDAAGVVMCRVGKAAQVRLSLVGVAG